MIISMLLLFFFPFVPICPFDYFVSLGVYRPHNPGLRWMILEQLPGAVEVMDVSKVLNAQGCRGPGRT